MRRFVGVLGVLALLLSSLLAWHLHRQRRDQEAPPGSSGVLEGTRVAVTARIAARIEAIRVQEGDRVREGDVLVDLDCQEPVAAVREAEARLQAARAQVLAAEAQAEAVAAGTRAVVGQARVQQAQAGSVSAQARNARRQSERAVRLDREGALPTAQRETLETTAEDLSLRHQAALQGLDAARQQARAAEAQARAAERQVEAAQRQVAAAEAALDRIRVTAGECLLKAPRSGVVTLRAREPGELALPGTLILEITDDEELTVTFYVPNRDLARVEVGIRVDVQADPWPGERFQGTVRRVSREAEFTPRTIQTREDRDRLVYAVEAVIRDASRRLRPGMPVEVRLAGPGDGPGGGS
ncbi:MAG TPA: HlyD family efflux transporter periplasmic adaptor subunit [Myxococcota bacterium]|nr:HlyD family efflux transporter periplasmic adaptor subunit [Myxococcota bacterium]HQK49751.1 HlyD family efflux transporter periplasmic adaptor subunit [Myxococcota bacterium]